MATSESFKILLVDDNEHESYFFKSALSEVPVSISLQSTDGNDLLNHLSENLPELPDVLFLDLNMPRKNGFECLNDLKLSKEFKGIPVIIYSTSFDNIVADELYNNGAHYYVRKTDLAELKLILKRVVLMLSEKTFTRPSRDKFVFSVSPEA